MDDDIIQEESEIIPVINIEAGTPLVERPENSFLNRKDDDKPLNFLDTTHKVAEKLTGSLSVLSRSLKNSFDLGRPGDPVENLECDIDVIGTSPGNKFIATWSSEDGLLAVFAIDEQILRFTFSTITPFNKTNVNLDQTAKIYLSVSEDGRYVAITRMTIWKDHQTDTPNMDAVASDASEQLPESSFVVYSTKRSKKNVTILDSMKILSPLIFVHHHTLICFTKRNMHLFSTKFWILRDSVRIDALIQSSPNYSEKNNECLLFVYEIFHKSLKHGYLVWPEDKDGLSVWDINGVLRQWFYVEVGNIPYSRNLFVISNKGDLVARFSEAKKEKFGLLTIFHTPTALQISEVHVPKTVFYISFLNDFDQIILCSKEEEGVIVQLYDCWAGLLVYEEQRTHLNHEKPLLLIDDKFIQPSGKELFTYPLFPNNSPSVTMEALSRTSIGVKTDDTGLLITSVVERQQGIPVCWGHIVNDKSDLVCKFKFEPWHNWHNNEIYVHWLDPEGKRFMIAGKDSVQIYKTRRKSDHKFIKIVLQYIWISNTEEIRYITLETRGKNEPSIVKVQLTDNELINIPLPGENDKVTYRIVTDACSAIHFLRLQYMGELQYLNRLVIKEQLKKLIEPAIQLFPTAFNKISLGNNEYFCPMEDFILLGWDDLVKSIIDFDRYIPLFHNEEQTESALLLLVELQKSDLVEKMVNYIFNHVKYYKNKYSPPNKGQQRKAIQRPGFAWTLGKALLDIYKFYPDKGIYAMKESSYLTTSFEAPKRILKTTLGNPYRGEERSHFSELKAVSRKALLPRGTKRDDTRKRKFFPYFTPKPKDKSNDTAAVNGFNDTGSLGSIFFYAEGTQYSERKQILNKESHGIRERQRRERLIEARKTHPARLCVVPWPDFCVYPPLMGNYKSLSIFGKIRRFWNLYVAPSQRSPFADVALNGNSEMFSEVAMEAVVKFKWDKFAQKLFLINFITYLIHATFFCVIVSIDSDLVPPKGDPRGWKGPMFILGLIIPVISLIQEFRQMYGRWDNYWTSPFNYFDLASFGLPLACILMVVMGIEPPYWLKSYAVLCVWINMLLQARAFEGPGKFIAIVIEIGKQIMTLFLTLLIIVLGFANALFVLLRDVNPLDIVDQYTGNLTNETNGNQLGTVTLTQVPQGNTNMWDRLDTSVLATYFFLGIGWDSITSLDPDYSIYIMMVLFSLISVIVLLNVLIGLITDVFSGSLQSGRQAWLRQRAELIAELELFLLSPSTRKNPEWFPHLIYYEAHLDAIKNWKRKLYVEEIGELDAEFVRNELKSVKSDLNNELKELKGMVGQIRKYIKNPDGNEIGMSMSNDSSVVSL